MWSLLEQWGWWWWWWCNLVSKEQWGRCGTILRHQCLQSCLPPTQPGVVQPHPHQHWRSWRISETQCLNVRAVRKFLTMKRTWRNTLRTIIWTPIQPGVTIPIPHHSALLIILFLRLKIHFVPFFLHQNNLSILNLLISFLIFSKNNLESNLQGCVILSQFSQLPRKLLLCVLQ